jgi:predicted CopG family antitoxin
MAVKTITIDMEAYERLSMEKQEGESFSQVIKRVLKARHMTARSLLQRVQSISMADRTLDRIEEVVEGRKKELVHAPGLVKE